MRFLKLTILLALSFLPSLVYAQRINPGQILPPASPASVAQNIACIPSNTCSWSLPGVLVDASNPSTLLSTDRVTYLKWTSGSTLTLPVASGAFATNFPFVLQNLSATALAITPTTPNNIDGGSSQAPSYVPINFAAFVYQDSSQNWWSIRVPTIALFPGVSAGGCGDATHSCSFTINAAGIVTAFSNNVISASGGGALATVSLAAQTAAISATTLCSTGTCPSGQYHVNAYLNDDSTGVSVGSGVVGLSLLYTDNDSNVTYKLNLDGPSVTTKNIPLGTAGDFGQATFNFMSNGTQPVQYETNYTACTTGPCTYSLQMAIYQDQTISVPSSVAFSIYGGISYSNGSSSLTYTLGSSSGGSSIISGTNLVGFVDVVSDNCGGGGPTNISGVTWNGTSMTSAGAVNCNTSTRQVETFWIALGSGSVTATPTIVVSTTGSLPGSIVSDAFTVTGANQSAPVKSGSYTTANPTAGLTQAITVTSVSGNLVHTTLASNTNISSTSQTLIVLNNASNADSLGSDYASGASSITSTWTITASDSTPLLGFSITP